jgi:hypothetical protein
MVLAESGKHQPPRDSGWVTWRPLLLLNGSDGFSNARPNALTSECDPNDGGAKLSEEYPYNRQEDILDPLGDILAEVTAVSL